MTKFDCYLEKMEAQRKAEKENAYNAELARSLSLRTKRESLACLYENLTFIVGSSDILTANSAKTLVF